MAALSLSHGTGAAADAGPSLKPGRDGNRYRTAIAECDLGSDGFSHPG